MRPVCLVKYVDGRGECRCFRVGYQEAAGLLPTPEQGLELRGFGFFVYYVGGYLGEAGFFQHRFQFGFAEAEPLVGVELAGFFKAVPGRSRMAMRPPGARMRHASCRARAGWRAWWSDCEKKTRSTSPEAMGSSSMSPRRNSMFCDAVAGGLVAAHVDHAGGAVNGDDLAGALGEKQGEGALARAEVGDGHGRHEAQEGFGKALPGFAGDVVAAEAAGYGVKEGCASCPGACGGRGAWRPGRWWLRGFLSAAR